MVLGAAFSLGPDGTPENPPAHGKSRRLTDKKPAFPLYGNHQKNDNEGIANHRRANAKKESRVNPFEIQHGQLQAEGHTKQTPKRPCVHLGCHTAMMVNLKLSGWTGSCPNADFSHLQWSHVLLKHQEFFQSDKWFNHCWPKNV